jgi:hypothetical protein
VERGGKVWVVLPKGGLGDGNRPVVVHDRLREVPDIRARPAQLTQRGQEGGVLRSERLLAGRLGVRSGPPNPTGNNGWDDIAPELAEDRRPTHCTSSRPVSAGRADLWSNAGTKRADVPQPYSITRVSKFDEPRSHLLPRSDLLAEGPGNCR